MYKVLKFTGLFFLMLASCASQALTYRISHFVNKDGKNVYVFHDLHRDYMHNTISLNLHAQFLHMAKKLNAHVIAEDGDFYAGNNPVLLKYFAHQLQVNKMFKTKLSIADPKQQKVGWSCMMSEIVPAALKLGLTAESVEYRHARFAYEDQFEITAQDFINELDTVLQEITNYKYQPDDSYKKIIEDYHRASAIAGREKLKLLKSYSGFVNNDTSQVHKAYRSMFEKLYPLIDSKIIHAAHTTKNKNIFILTGGTHGKAVEEFFPTIGFIFQRARGPLSDSELDKGTNAALEIKLINQSADIIKQFFAMATPEEDLKKNGDRGDSKDAHKAEAQKAGDPAGATTAAAQSPANSAKQCAQCNSSLQKAFRCSQCKNSFYCSKECQRMHWPHHKGTCKKS